METKEILVQMKVRPQTRRDVRKLAKASGFTMWGLVKKLVDDYKAKAEDEAIRNQNS